VELVPKFVAQLAAPSGAIRNGVLFKQREEKFWEESGSPFGQENPREVTPEKPSRNYWISSWLNCHQYGKVSYP